MRVMVNVGDVEVVAPNFKRRLSGVTSTIIALLPQQAQHLGIAALGPGLPNTLPKIKWWQLPALWQKPRHRQHRLWHARRNIEMLAGVALKHLLRMPLKLIFTSAAQRHHTRFTKFLIRRMDAVIATGNRSASYLRVPHTIVPHGVDDALFHPPRPNVPADNFTAAGLPGKYAVGCFGRIRHQKGTDLFVSAMINLLPQYPDWTAIISGRITRRHNLFAEQLKQKINAAGLSDRIIFIGEVDDIRVWYRRLLLLVAPSRNEGFGLTPLEAMASQTAVVAADAGSYAEMISDEFEGGVPADRPTGAVVEANNAQKLTQAIKRYFDEPHIALAHGKNARAHIQKHFTLANEVAGIAAVYETLWQATP